MAQVRKAEVRESILASFAGKVRSRLFRYIRTEHGLMCLVNIVIEDTKDDWGKLVRE